MIKYEKSDNEEEENNGEYKDPEVLDPELPPEDKFFYDWTQRN